MSAAPSAMKEGMFMDTFCVLPSPFGPLRLAANDAGVTHLLFPEQPVPEGAEEGETPLLTQAALELEEYFDRRRTLFTVPLCPAGTPFQQSVWAALQTIPCGRTAGYRDIAVKLGRPNAARAVGQANGKNPIPILIPCHRVVTTGGSLGGYSLGLDVKRRLLALEGVRIG